MDENNLEKKNLTDNLTYIGDNFMLGLESSLAGIGVALGSEGVRIGREGANMSEAEIMRNVLLSGSPDALVFSCLLKAADLARTPNMTDEEKVNEFKSYIALYALQNTSIGLNISSTINFIDKIENNLNRIDFKDYEGKSFLEMLPNVFADSISLSINSEIDNNGSAVFTSVLGKYFPESIDNTEEFMHEKMIEPVQNKSEDLALESQDYGKVTNIAGNVTQSLGNIGPSIVAAVVNPIAGLYYSAISSKGQNTSDALNKGADLEKAIKVGNAKAAVETAPELLTGGLKVFGKGALDDILQKGVIDNIQNKVAQSATKIGLDVTGEVVEETITDVLSTFIDRATIDPNAKYTLQDFENTATTTSIITLIANAMTHRLVKNRNNNFTNLEKDSNTEKQTVSKTNSSKQYVNLTNNPNIDSQIDESQIQAKQINGKPSYKLENMPGLTWLSQARDDILYSEWEKVQPGTDSKYAQYFEVPSSTYIAKPSELLDISESIRDALTNNNIDVKNLILNHIKEISGNSTLQNIICEIDNNADVLNMHTLFNTLDIGKVVDSYAKSFSGVIWNYIDEKDSSGFQIPTLMLTDKNALVNTKTIETVNYQKRKNGFDKNTGIPSMQVNASEISTILNSDLTLENAVSLLKLENIFEGSSLAQAISDKLKSFKDLEQAQKIVDYDKVANEIYLLNGENNTNLLNEILGNTNLQKSLAQMRANGLDNTNPYIGAYVELLENYERQKYLQPRERTNEKTSDNSRTSSSNISQEKTNNSGITQVTESVNSIYIECDKLFTDLDAVVKSYMAKGFLKSDMNVILSGYDNMLVPLEQLETIKNNIKNYTSNILAQDSELTKFVKSELSIRKNFNMLRSFAQKDLTLPELFQKGLETGSYNASSLPYITKAILESQGIDSEITESGLKLNLDGTEFTFDPLSAKRSFATNLGKYLKPNNDSLGDLSSTIKGLVKQNKQNTPNIHNNSIFEKIKSVFGFSKQNALPAPETTTPTVEEQKLLNICNSSPAGMINDDILWEIQTWDKSNIKNQVITSYVLLPKIGSPEQILSMNPEMISGLLENMQNLAKDESIKFLGGLHYDSKLDSWTASLPNTQEIKDILPDAINLIGQKIETNTILNRINSSLQRVSDEPEVANTSSSNQHLTKQINLQNNMSQNSTSQQNNTPNSQNLDSSNKQSLKPETIVISDLHSRLDSWEAVKEQIEQNPNLNVIILGDAMDRGPYGIEILMQIKELSDAGRVKYVPGNHDEFAYNLLRSIQEGFDLNNPIMNSAFNNLKYNKGIDTLNKIQNFNQTVKDALDNQLITKPIRIEELTKWLGSQPLQLIQKGANNVTYGLAHALFDSQLYSYDKNFNLEKAFNLQLDKTNNKANNILQHFKNVLWYRAEDKNTHYAPVNWSDDLAMIVGHTPQKNGVNLKYFNGDFSKPMIYIDGGLINKLGGFSLDGHIINNLEDRQILEETQEFENGR